MAAGSPELRLGVSFDLQNFKTVALPSLVQAASSFDLTIGIKFDRTSINEEMRLLGRQLGQRKYRIDLDDTSIKSAIAQVDKLAGKLSGVRGSAGKARALGGVISTAPKDGGPSAPQVQSIFGAAKELGIVKGAADRTRKELVAELKTGFALAGEEAMAGLIQGILKGEGQLQGIAASLGAKLLQALEQSLEIRSPSRKMRRIGQQAGQGFNDGLIASLQEATRNAVALVNASLRKLDRVVELRQRKARAIAPGQPGFELAQREAGVAIGRRERVQNQAEVLQLRGAAGQFEGGSYQALSKLLQSLQIEASEIKPNTPEWNNLQQRIAQVNLDLQRAGKLAEEIQMRKSLEAYSPGSLASLESRLVILKSRAREIAPDTTEWKALNREIQKTERLAEKADRKPITKGQRLGAAGGAFLYGGGMGGGVGSALGGVAGGLLGGVPGAFTGAAIGQVTDSVLASVSAMTTQASALMQMQRGLALASIDAKDFAEAQSTVASMSQRLLMPLEQTTRLFTQLRVNTKQYNLSVKDTAEIMEGTALAIMSTGGSADDLEGAMRAVVQIMSKGGVQAEELRGQLGERFPGAVVKFAQANKLSFEQLQEGLEQGKIGIKEFIAFAEKNYTDYAEFSKQLATAPEFAGRRLQIALEELSREVGALFAPIGAEIQDALTGAIKEVAKFITENRAYLRQFISDWASIIGPIVKVLGQLLGVVAKFGIEVGKVFQGLFSQIRQAIGMATIGEAKARLDRARAATAGKTRPQGNVRGGGPFQELDQAEQAFAALGGEAAWRKANAPAVPSNLTFGGPGAGMSLDRLGKSKDSKAKKLDTYDKSKLDFYDQQYTKEKQILDKKLQNNLLSQTAYDIKLADLALDTEKLKIQERFRLNSEKIQKDNLSQADKNLALADEEIRRANALSIAIEDRSAAVKGAKKKLSTPFIEALRDENIEIDKQTALLDNLAYGYDALTPEQEANFLIQEKIGSLKADEQEVIQTDIDNLRKQLQLRIENNRAIKEQQALLGLRQQLALAQAPNEDAVLRLRIAQQYPEANEATREAMFNAEKQLQKANKIREAFNGIAQSIGDSFGNAFKSIISGSSSVLQVMANFFQSIGDYFVDMTARMISEWLKVQVFEGLMNLLPGLGSFGKGAKIGQSVALPAGIGIGSGGGIIQNNMAQGFGTFGPNFGIRQFASGGIVTGPTLGLIGEGRYNEAIIPMPNGKSVPVELGGAMGSPITSNIVVNVSSDGKTSSSNTGSDSAGLGRRLEGAVKQVIVDELRPGGLLSGRR